MDEILREIVLNKLCQMLIVSKLRWIRYQDGLSLPGVELSIILNETRAEVQVWRVGFFSYSTSLQLKEQLAVVALCDEGCFEAIIEQATRHAITAPDAHTAAKELRYELSKGGMPPTVVAMPRPATGMARDGYIVVRKWPNHQLFPINIKTGWHGYDVKIEYKSQRPK